MSETALCDADERLVISEIVTGFVTWNGVCIWPEAINTVSDVLCSSVIMINDGKKKRGAPPPLRSFPGRLET